MTVPPGKESSKDSKLDQAVAYEAATHAWDRQHDRWTQWIVFYFSIVAADFLAWAQVDDEAVFPLWVAAAVGAAVSFGWVAVALAIRRQAKSWREVVEAVEAGTSVTPFADYRKKLKQHTWREFFTDLGLSLMIWRRDTLFSVTRWAVLLGLLATTSMVTLAVSAYPAGVGYCIV